MKYFLLLMLCITMNLVSVEHHTWKQSPSIFKIEDNKITPYYGKNTNESSRVLGAVQLNPGSSGIEIVNSGSYILGSNVNASNASGAIIIEADDVILNLNNFYVSNSAGPGIVIGASGARINASVINGIIKDCAGDGLSVDQLTNGCFSELLFESNTSSGCTAGSNASNLIFQDCHSISNVDTGFTFSASNVVEFRRCASLNNQQDGFNLSGSVITFDLCMSNANTGSGITNQSGNISQLHIQNTQIYGNSGSGIALSQTSADYNINIEDNDIVDNGGNGIDIQGSRAINIKNNTVTSNDRGISVTGTSASTTVSTISILQNEVKNNRNQGIYVENYRGLVGTKNIIIGNGTAASTPSNSSGAGFYLDDITGDTTPDTIGIVGDNYTAFNTGYGIYYGEATLRTGFSRNLAVFNNDVSSGSSNFNFAAGARQSTSSPSRIDAINQTTTNGWTNIYV
jgi:parallel beta-helix repeat protein